MRRAPARRVPAKTGCTGNPDSLRIFHEDRLFPILATATVSESQRSWPATGTARPSGGTWRLTALPAAVRRRSATRRSCADPDCWNQRALSSAAPERKHKLTTAVARWRALRGDQLPEWRRKQAQFPRAAEDPRQRWLQCLTDNFFRISLPDDNSVLDSKLDEIGVRPKAEILHDSVLMKCHRTGRDFQHPRGLFHRFPLCQKLDNLSLTRS